MQESDKSLDEFGNLSMAAEGYTIDFVVIRNKVCDLFKKFILHKFLNKSKLIKTIKLTDRSLIEINIYHLFTLQIEKSTTLEYRYYLTLQYINDDNSDKYKFYCVIDVDSGLTHLVSFDYNIDSRLIKDHFVCKSFLLIKLILEKYLIDLDNEQKEYFNKIESENKLYLETLDCVISDLKRELNVSE